ncbi:thiamine-phosphate diphosphorylase [Tistlia consotensis]|uniref:Thiamine-phosphate synthase n=1 Tax=Tistlia consotensis USBA 355 TaxID=560819 RepID=A0A1Y6B6T6_9PROT|nr:thiamine phosphate synthase [Tistlia consotensis]SME88240.1 thiamine-phosphate diphosphorylase [Tistlia consotensis USBA 355]SNR24696.1 thiamine-phosphate diphosphorylase [Tistlia consotensis]
MSRPVFDLSVYLVVGPADCRGRPVPEVVAAALRGGVTLVQLRDKEASEADYLALGRAVRGLCAEARVPFVVNDRVEAVAALEAEGLHVGQEDLAAEAARAAIGPDRLLGLSVHAPEQLAGLAEGAVDYLGVGPVFPTASKADARPASGAGGIALIRGATALPIVAIGGLDAARAAVPIVAGAGGVAVVSAIAGAPDPEAAARALVEAVAAARLPR